jgi:hypothetical protein
MADQRKRRRRADLGWIALDARRATRRLTGARLCFGKPVHVGSRTVIPVASLRTIGGFGFGRAPEAAGPEAEPPSDAERLGGGGGGLLDARPIGFIDIGPEGACYRSIPHARPRATVTGAVLAGLGAWAGARALRARRPAHRRPSLGRGRRRGRARRPPAAALPWPRR